MTEYWMIKSSGRCGMQIGEICSAIAFELIERVCWPACKVNVILCDKACVIYYREGIPSYRNFTPILFFGITEMIGLKHTKFFDWKVL